jgi:hypothetical protein
MCSKWAGEGQRQGSAEAVLSPPIPEARRFSCIHWNHASLQKLIFWVLLCLSLTQTWFLHLKLSLKFYTFILSSKIHGAFRRQYTGHILLSWIFIHIHSPLALFRFCHIPSLLHSMPIDISVSLTIPRKVLLI